MLHSVNGVRLNVLDEGEGHPVLFLHGLGGCWRDWEPQLDAFRETNRVIVVEHRGHGRSEATTGRYRTDLFAADAVTLCADLGIEHAYVVGLSMGGLIAQHVALQAPALVDALVLCDTGAHMGAPMAEGLIAVARSVRAHGFPDSRGELPATSPAWGASSLATKAQVVRNNQRETDGTDPDAWSRAAYAVAEHDTRSELGRLTMPVLLVWGSDDLLIPIASAIPLQAGIPDTRLVVLDGGGHVCNLDQPEAFNAAVSDFFAAHPCPHD